MFGRISLDTLKMDGEMNCAVLYSWVCSGDACLDACVLAASPASRNFTVASQCGQQHNYKTKKKKKKEKEKTENIMCQVSCFSCQVSGVRCQASGVRCHISHVTCHFSLTPTATVTDPLPANTPTIHSQQDCLQRTKFQKNLNC